jgi:RNA-binding protein
MTEQESTPALPGALRRTLKAQAQRLEAGLRMGKAGLSEEFITSVDRELSLHELVKVRFTDSQDQRHELADEIAKRTTSHVIQVVGHVAVVYRAKPTADQKEASVEVK